MTNKASAPNNDPSTYLSYSEGKFRVIDQGVPISADKSTAGEAMAVANQFRLKVSDRAWSGNFSRWIELETYYK